MTFEQKISECLKNAQVPFELDNGMILVSQTVGANEVFKVLEQHGGFHHMPTVLEVEA